MKNKIIDSIGKIDDDMIESVDALRQSQKKRAKTTWTKWAAAAACLCLAAAGILRFTGIPGVNHVQTWKASYTGADYFMYAGTGDGPSSEKSIAVDAIQYAESRDYSKDRSLMEENEVIPSMESHPLYSAQANFNDDGSIYSIVLSWHRRDLEGVENYSDLRVTAGDKEIPEIEDCVFVEIDENGKVLEPMVTVTERDGVQIIARGRENQKKTITFQNDTGWYQISGSWNDSYEDVAALFEWFWNHPIDFSQFKQEAGDLYTYTTLKEMPNAFSDSLPDFPAYGFVCGYSVVTLKNGQPTAFEAVYVSNVTEEKAENEEYTAGENGVVQIHWCLKTEPDFYDLEGCIGDINNISKDQIHKLGSPDNATTQTKIQLRQDDNVLIIYTTDTAQAWALIESIR